MGDFVSDRAVSGIGIVGVVGAVAEIVHRTVLDRSTAAALVVLGTVALASCVLLSRAFTHPVPTPPPEPHG
jgi:energy-converting hydrogenase Eha subunit C